MIQCIGLREGSYRRCASALLAPVLLVIFALDSPGCTSPENASGGGDADIVSDSYSDIHSDVYSGIDSAVDAAVDAPGDASAHADARLDSTDGLLDDVWELEDAPDSEMAEVDIADAEAADSGDGEVHGADVGAVLDGTSDQSEFDAELGADVDVADAWGDADALDDMSDADAVASEPDSEPASEPDSELDAVADTASMQDAETDADADTEDVGSSSLCPDWSQQGWTSDPPYDLCSPVVVQASLKTSIIPDVTNTATPFPTPGVLDHVIDFGAKFTYKWGDPLGIYEFQGGTLQALSVGPNDTVWLGWHQWVAPPKPPQVDPGLLINQIFVGRTSKDDVTVTSFPLGGTLLSTTPLHTVHWVTTAASGEVFAHVAAPGLYSVDSGPDFPQWALFLLDPSGPELLFPSPKYSAGIPALTKVTMQGDDFVCLPWLLPPGQLTPPDCADWSLARIAATGEPLWSTFVGNDGSGDDAGGFTGGDDPVVLGNCGYAAMEMLYYIPSEVTGYLVPKLPRVSYFTPSGELAMQRYLQFGYIGFGDLAMDAHGLEIVAARAMNGTYQAPLFEFGPYMTGVVRLHADGTYKWFTVVGEPEVGGSALLPDDLLALPSGLTILMANAGSSEVKAAVLDPDGVILAVYLFDGSSSADTDKVEHMFHLHRLSDGSFVAHDTVRVYFFRLPAVEEWEAANPSE